MELYISSMTLQIRYCRTFFHNALWKQSKTWPDYTLYYIRTGTLDIQIQSVSYQAGPGDVIVLFPGDYGTMEAKTDCSFLLVCFRMDAGNFHHLLHQLNSAGIYHSDTLAQAGDALCRSFSGETQNPLRFSPRQYAVFSAFLAELIERAGKQTPFHPASAQYADWKLNRLLRHMEQSAPAILPIRELAEQMEMSEKYFIQYFHRQVGCTPGQYMNRQRMYHAAELLSDARLSLEEIAHMLFYSDSYAFSKAFRKYYGESPGRFRAHIKQEE